MSPVHERFTVNGIALGQTRREVDSHLGYPFTNSNLSWARYRSPDSGLLLVKYRSAGADDALDDWTVESLCGSELRWNGQLFLRIGSQIQEQSWMLGQPQEFYESEPGIGCLDFSGCQVSFDICSGRVLEVSLHSPRPTAELLLPWESLSVAS